MAGDITEHEEVLTPEQEAEADAEFAAAFNQTREHSASHVEGSTKPNDAEVSDDGEKGQTALVDDAAAAAQAEAEARAAAEAEAAKAAAEANTPAAITKAELAALQAQLALVPQLHDEIKRTRDTTAGKLGSLQQQLQTLAAKAAAGQKPAIKEMKRMREEYPELAQIFEADLTDAFGANDAAAAHPGDQSQGDGQQPPVQQAVNPMDDPEVVKVLRTKERAIVDAIFPDWRTKTNADGTVTPGFKDSAEFAEWRQQLPPGQQQLLANSWESHILVDAFKDFQNWNAQRRATTTAQAAAQAEAAKQRDKRLDNAMPATNGQATGINAVDDDAAFESGFKQVRTGRG